MANDNSKNIGYSKRVTRDPLTGEQTKQLLVDPNVGNENVPIENLSIECELSVYERSRSFIKVVQNANKESRKLIGELKEKNAPFNQGGELGKNFSLTTDYTRVSDMNYDGTETLGITSVTVDYNSSYMPLVTIELTDVRGKMFQMGKSGPYSSFFNFPYPLFELKIKGYYGKPVIYLLHMTKFTSRMDSDNGNFVITCNFTGYTYAYLSDMLIGFLKAVPHTTVGFEEMQKKKDRDGSFVSFELLREYGNKLHQEIEGLKETDDIKSLALAHDAVAVLRGIKNDVFRQIKILDGTNFDSKAEEPIMLFVKGDSTTNKSYSNMHDYLTDDIAEKIAEYNKMMEGSDHKLSVDLVVQKEGHNTFEKLKKTDFLDADGNVLGAYAGTLQRFKVNPGPSDIGSTIVNRKHFERVARRVYDLASKINDESSFHVVYVFELISNIDSKISFIENEIKDGEKIAMDESMNKFSNLTSEDEEGNIRTFDFNIENYTKVLADHVDILMNTIESVGNKAEDNAARNEALLANGQIYDIDPKILTQTQKVYAFPDYEEKYKPEGSSAKETFADEWIGIKYPDINEVIFIKELYQGILTSQKQDEIFLTELQDTNTQWYGVNPFDCGLFTNKENPWKSVGNSSGADGEILRLMAMRAITFLGITVRTPTEKEIKAMARLEAENLYRTILNADIKDFMASMGNKDEDIAVQIRKFVNNRNALMRNQMEIVHNNNILTNKKKWTYGNYNGEDESAPLDLEEYVYIGGHVTSTKVNDILPGGTGRRDEGTRFFLPLYFVGNTNGFKGDAFFKGNDFISNEERVNLRASGNIFFGNYMGNHVKGENRPDDGATYIKLIDDNTYKNEEMAEIQYGGNHLEGIKTGFVWEYEDVKNSDFTDVLFNGKFNSNEFMKYKKGSSHYDFLNFFYKDETVAENPTALMFYNSYSKALASIKKTPYYLFGSSHYYAQSREGRAFLFLSSIPFNIKTRGTLSLDGKLFHDEILGLFDKKAGMIQVPRSWVLYLGSIIDRRRNGDNLIYSRGGYNTIPGGVNPIGVDQLIMIDDSPHVYSKPILYVYHEDVLKKLPESVKDIFHGEFTTWVKEGGEWDELRSHLELFNDTFLDSQEAKNYYVNIGLKPKAITEKGFINKKAMSTYKSIAANPYNGTGGDIEGWIKDDNMNELVEDYGIGITNFDIPMNTNSHGYQTVLRGFLQESKIIVNATWRIWADDLDTWFTDRRVSYDSTFPIIFKTDNFDKYLTALVTEFRGLVKDFHDDDLRRSQIFGSNNLNEIYLTMYKNIKSINDKWISGEKEEIKKSFSNLIDTFKFIDRGYNKIGQAFKLNPMHVTALLTSNYNTSFYTHIVKILNNNNFDFIPMPNYIDMQNPDTIRDMFRTYSYGNSEGTATASFVCMYIGEQSSRLDDMGDNFPGDGINFGDEKELPDDFLQVPSILVKYGDQNQSIFKSIQLDQAEFSETNESLMTTDQIATSYNNINSVGQNIFDVYNNRAYNAQIEMMGNAMIQPFLYFQLDNIPMFRGGYVIKKVSHTITPHMMTTSILGNRVKRVKTKLLDKEAVFYSMIGDLSKISTGDAKYDNIRKLAQRSRSTSSNNDGPMPTITANMTDEEIYKKCFKPKGGDFKDKAIFNNKSNTKKNGEYMTYAQIFQEVSQLTGVPVLTLEVMSIMESGVHSSWRTNSQVVINGSAYTGLMQFGKTAASDLVDEFKLNTKFFSIPNLDQYEFYATIDRTNKKLSIPSSWTTNRKSNNETTNSWHDDFISTYAAAQLALRNIITTKSDLNNVADVYLAHQQGAGGLRSILRNPLDSIDGNAANNPPPHFQAARINQQWYLAWAAHVEASGRALDENYPIIVGKGVV